MEFIGSDDFRPDSTTDMSSSLQQHLDECEACRAELAGMLEAFAAVGMSAAAPIPEGLEQRIADRVLSAPATPAVVETSSFWRTPLVSYALAATILAMIVGGQFYYLQRMTAVANATRDPSDNERVAALEQAVAELARLQQVSQNNKIQFVSLQPNDDDASIFGHAIWDEGAKTLHFFGFGMRPSEPGKQYVLWFVDDKVAHRATTIQPNLKGVTNIEIAAPKGVAPQTILITLDTPDAKTPSDDVMCRALLQSP